MNLSKSNTVFSFGPFKHSLSPNAYNVIEFAWPVKAFECYANKIESGTLDALALTVLELLNLQYLRLDHIADDLGISKELLGHIIDHELLSKGYCEQNKKEFKVTEKGAEYLRDITTNEISKEKVFGYMFQSLVDGEFFPFFYEGTLPDPWHNKDGLYYVDVKSKQEEQNEDSTALLNKINRAYHKYGYIYHKSKEVSENSLFDENMFVDAEDDIQDQDFDYEADLENSSLSEEEKKELTNLKNARIKLLKTSPKELYIKFRLYALKDDPNSFQINSPFEENETKWYSESFARMRRDSNVIFGEIGSKMENLESFCSSVTNQMYAEIPELKEMKPEEYLERTYPEIFHSSMKKNLQDLYLKLIRQELLHQKYGNNEADVLSNRYRILEYILKQYIKRTNHNCVVGDYFKIVDPAEIESIRLSFKIANGCEAFDSEIKKYNKYEFRSSSLMKGFWGQKLGNSLRDKYYYLTFDAYNRNESGFKRALLQDGNIIFQIDYINKKRNEFGGHDGLADYESLKKTKEYFDNISKILVLNFDK